MIVSQRTYISLEKSIDQRNRLFKCTFTHTNFNVIWHFQQAWCHFIAFTSWCIFIFFLTFFFVYRFVGKMNEHTTILMFSLNFLILIIVVNKFALRRSEKSNKDKTVGVLTWEVCVIELKMIRWYITRVNKKILIKHLQERL